MFAIGLSATISLPSTSALFFFRVKGVYYDNKLVQVLFGVMWLLLVASTLTIPPAIKGAHIRTTQICMMVKVEDYEAVAAFLNALFDTLVFLAVSYRIMTSTPEGSVRTQAGTFFRGDGLSSISRALLQGGQLYYLFVALSPRPCH
jgi:hypothetical protein